MKARIVSFRRGRHTQTPNQMILQIKGVDSREKAKQFIGKRVIWTSPGKHKKQIVGTITYTHGNKGVLRALFERGMPGQSFNDWIPVGSEEEIQAIREQTEKKIAAEMKKTQKDMPAETRIDHKKEIEKPKKKGKKVEVKQEKKPVVKKRKEPEEADTFPKKDKDKTKKTAKDAKSIKKKNDSLIVKHKRVKKEKKAVKAKKKKVAKKMIYSQNKSD